MADQQQSKPPVTERQQRRNPPPQQTQNDSGQTPNDGERITHPSPDAPVGGGPVKTPGGGSLTVNPEGGDDNAPRMTHPPAGQAVKKAEDGSGRDVYPSDDPDLYGSPRPTDADGTRKRE